MNAGTRWSPRYLIAGRIDCSPEAHRTLVRQPLVADLRPPRLLDLQLHP